MIRPRSALHLGGRRLSIVVTLAVLAAAAAAAIGLLTPADYQATTTVWVTRVLPPGTGGDVESSIDDFQATVKLVSIDRAVGRATGQSADALQDDITFSQLGESSAETVGYVASTRRVASQVVTMTSTDALEEIARQAVEGADAQVAAATSELDSASAALASFDAGQGADVGQSYQDTQQDIASLNSQLTVVSASQVPLLVTAIAAAQARLDKLAAALPEWQQLDNAVTQATTALATAQGALTVAQGQSISARSSTVMTPVHVRSERSVLDVALLAAVALLVALAAATAVFVVSDVLANRDDRQDARAGPGGADPAPERERDRAGVGLRTW